MPADEAEQELKARMWAAAIYDDITYPEAQQIVVTHYQSSKDTIGVADINHPPHTPLPPGYYSNAELTAGAGIREPDPTRDKDWTPPPQCDDCGRRYVHTVECGKS